MGSHVVGPPGCRAWCKCGNMGRTLAGHSGAEHSRPSGHCLPSRDTTVPSFSKGAVVGCGQERTAPGAYCRLGYHNFRLFTNTHLPLSSLLSSATDKGWCLRGVVFPEKLCSAGCRGSPREAFLIPPKQEQHVGVLRRLPRELQSYAGLHAGAF